MYHKLWGTNSTDTIARKRAIGNSCLIPGESLSSRWERLFGKGHFPKEQHAGDDAAVVKRLIRLDIARMSKDVGVDPQLFTS